MRVQAFHFMCATKSDIECVCVQQKESQKVRVCMCVWDRERPRARARERERERDRGETGKAAMDFFVCCNSSLDRSSLGWWNEGWGEISATSGQVTFRPNPNLSDFKKDLVRSSWNEKKFVEFDFLHFRPSRRFLSSCIFLFGWVPVKLNTSDLIVVGEVLVVRRTTVRVPRWMR